MDDKSNRSTAIPALRKTLVLDGGVMTINVRINVRSCRKQMAQTIRDRSADDVLVLKDNQLQLHAAVVETFAVEQAETFEGCDYDDHKTVNKTTTASRCASIGCSERWRTSDTWTLMGPGPTCTTWS